MYYKNYMYRNLLEIVVHLLRTLLKEQI